MVTPASHVSLPFSIQSIPIGFHLLLSGRQATTLNKQFLDVKLMLRGHYEIPDCDGRFP